MSDLVPGVGELTLIAYIVVVVAIAHNLGRLGNALGRVFARLSGKE